MKAITLIIDKIFLNISSIFTAFFTKKTKTKRKYKKRITQELRAGEYASIKDLLEDLDRIFIDVKRMTPRRNSNAQSLVRKYGPHIAAFSDSPGGEDMSVTTLESFQAYGCPAFLINYHNTHNKKMGKDEKGDNFCEQFIVASRLHKPPFFSKKKGYAYYEVTLLLYDDGKQMKVPAELDFIIQIKLKTGKVTALRKEIPSTHVFKKSSYTSYQWKYPDYQDDENKTTFSQAGMKQHLERVFISTYNLVMRREYGINILVKKGKYRATFAVPVHTWKYFFKDRIKAKTKNGNTKPIFHWVSSHIRHAKTGDQNIKTHMRGMRNFWWNTYSIKIILPGKHGASQASFNVEAYLPEDIPSDDKGIDITKGDFNTLTDLFEGNK